MDVNYYSRITYLLLVVRFYIEVSLNYLIITKRRHFQITECLRHVLQYGYVLRDVIEVKSGFELGFVYCHIRGRTTLDDENSWTLNID